MTDPSDRPPLFDVLSRAEARAYLARFVRELPASQDRMADMLASSGGNPRLAQDLSPGSLDPLWETAVQRWDLSYQADYVPNAAHPMAPPLQEGTWEALAPVEQLPSWFAHDWSQFMSFSPSTLWVIDVLARHMGRVLIQNHPDLSWMIGPDRPAQNVDRSRPVVGRGRAWINTIRRTSVLVERTIWDKHPPHGSRTLGAQYQTMQDEKKGW